MEATRSIEELRQYLDKFEKDMSEIDIGHLEIPKFSIPNWPEKAGNVTVNLWLKSALCPMDGRESNLLNLKRKLFRRIRFCVSEENGAIDVRAARQLTGLYDSPTWSSNSNNSERRIRCFIVFSQFLNPLCNKIIRILRKRYLGYKKEADEFNRICEAVKKSFEPLIPFVVADALSGEANHESR